MACDGLVYAWSRVSATMLSATMPSEVTRESSTTAVTMPRICRWRLTLRGSTASRSTSISRSMTRPRRRSESVAPVGHLGTHQPPDQRDVDDQGHAALRNAPGEQERYRAEPVH